MNTGGRLIAGSHNRNEFVLINADENARVRYEISQLHLSFDLGFSVPVRKSFPFLFSGSGFDRSNSIRIL